MNSKPVKLRWIQPLRRQLKRLKKNLKIKIKEFKCIKIKAGQDLDSRIKIKRNKGCPGEKV